MSKWRSRELRSFSEASLAIASAIRSERHMRFHLVATVVVVAVGLWLRVGRNDWLWLLGAIAAVWIAELINTAIERTVDLVTLEIHPLAKAAKDTAAGAVLVAALFAIAAGLIVLGPPFWSRLTG
ncbi:MAG: diacylglycerol kinase family protein [Candidatus Cohnella colombiensis]|uniref:Diacylglycerol kinase family protein n=1 Tax=Candidatus Cohnella colombiensis TaxID=3121368 RepID=A0AA95JAJ1_9BACL|nr:MAG: diacylglycerol kinase family protein [Cohnella sp.]